MQADVMGFGHFDDATDLEALFREDAAGRLVWGISQRGDRAGDFLLRLVEAAPAFRPKAVSLLGRLAADASLEVRALALDLMASLGAPEHLQALFDALVAAPRPFWAATAAPPWLGGTLLRAWLCAFAANVVYDRAAAEKLLSAVGAMGLLGVPEGGDLGARIAVAVGPQAVLDHLPAIAEHGDAEALAQALRPTQYDDAARAMSTASLGARDRFARALRHHARKRGGEPEWQRLARLLGVEA